MLWKLQLALLGSFVTTWRTTAIRLHLMVAQGSVIPRADYCICSQHLKNQLDITSSTFLHQHTVLHMQLAPCHACAHPPFQNCVTSRHTQTAYLALALLTCVWLLLLLLLPCHSPPPEAEEG
jgi:hypothetical protein